MLVCEAMTKNPVTCKADTPLREVVALFKKHHIGGLPVMDGSRLVGMVTESDLISLLETERISGSMSTGKRPSTHSGISAICRQKKS